MSFELDLTGVREVHIHLHDTSHAQLEEIITLLHRIDSKGTAMATDLTHLTAEVQEVQDVQQSAITLINGLAQAVRDAGTDPAALAALADQLDSSSNALAAAVAANPLPTTETPAEPTPEPVPAEPGTEVVPTPETPVDVPVEPAPEQL